MNKKNNKFEGNEKFFLYLCSLSTLLRFTFLRNFGKEENLLWVVRIWNISMHNKSIRYFMSI